MYLVSWQGETGPLDVAEVQVELIKTIKVNKPPPGASLGADQIGRLRRPF